MITLGIIRKYDMSFRRWALIDGAARSVPWREGSLKVTQWFRSDFPYILVKLGLGSL
jgi:hypothetical protein